MVVVLRGHEGVAQAAQLLRQGECVALPTETVYGLAADATNDAAVEKIFHAKGRPKNHPMIVHIPSADYLEEWAIAVPSAARRLAAACWPGPLTLLLKKSPKTSLTVTGGLQSVALRVPSHPLFLDVLQQIATGLAAPSANRYTQLSPTTAEQVIKSLQGYISAVLDGGPCEFGLESTIVDFTQATPQILRAGPLSRGQLEELLGQAIDMPAEHETAVPGNVRAHYQPRTALRVLAAEDLTGSKIVSSTSGFVIHSDAAAISLAATGVADKVICHLPAAARDYGKALYSALHYLDQLGLKTLFIEQPPVDDNWAAVNDRLKRAVGQS
ncbi:MAG: L-threonylcarbamoyladenylate synthase [bacterium]